jgi:hypothetical protein
MRSQAVLALVVAGEAVVKALVVSIEQPSEHRKVWLRPTGSRVTGPMRFQCNLEIVAAIMSVAAFASVATARIAHRAR